MVRSARLETVPLAGLTFYLDFIIIIVSVCNKTDNLIKANLC